MLYTESDINQVDTTTSSMFENGALTINTIQSSPMLVMTPSPKRRRGRPPKCPQSSDKNSPAATLSAAVMKQGTPKASAPLMRISPVKSEGSPVQRRKVNPSPKGGTLLMLDSTPTKPRKNSKIWKNHTKDQPKLLMVSTQAQQNIQSLTSDGNDLSRTVSVNPSLLLSSPITTNKIKEINKNRMPQDSALTDLKYKWKRPQKSLTSSSPMTPQSSSCFSSIMQSSPLYHGYYVNQNSSPSTSVLCSSPVKLQVRPMELPDVKPVDETEVQKIQELPLNPSNSPILKPSDPLPKITTANTQDLSQYRISMSVDENGQAKVTKVFTGKPSTNTHKDLPISPKLSKSHSADFIPNAKLNNEFSMFVEPSKVTDMFNETDSHLGFEVNTPIAHQTPVYSHDEDSYQKAEDDEFKQQDVLMSDARSALIQMIRRSTV